MLHQWVMVGGHLFGLLALVMHLSKRQFGSAFGSRAIMGYYDMQIYLLPLDFIRLTTLRNRNTTTYHQVR